MLGEYRPEQRTGPAIWLRCMIERTLESPEIPHDTTPVLYLPGVGRPELGAAETCPARLKPLVELQYRGVCWTQKNGRDWTAEAFLVSHDGGLGLDVARDATTRESLLHALTELATTPVQALRGRRLEAEDFDRLLSDDPVKDVLVWLSDARAAKDRWEGARWKAFRSRCKADLGSTWNGTAPWSPRNCSADETVPGMPCGAGSPNRRPCIPACRICCGGHDRMTCSRSVRRGLRRTNRMKRPCGVPFPTLVGSAPTAARAEIGRLASIHGERRGWVWAKFGQAPLARALEYLATVAEGAAQALGGASAADLARLYAAGAWRIDAAALAAAAAVRSAADAHAVGAALQAIYLPWLEAGARHLQALAEQEPQALRDPPLAYAAGDEAGTVILFADGLRFDVAQRLAERLRAGGRTVAVATRWAGLPTVTATAKPAVSPVTQQISGVSPGEEFRPVTATTGQSLTTERFRRLVEAAGYQYLAGDETGDPSGRAWTERGQIDRLGHSLPANLAARIGDEIELLRERVEVLVDAGWQTVRIVTDHGWLWLPGGLPKVDLPLYLTESRWARCAAIAGESTVRTPVVGWHWNPDQRVAVAPGVACFGTGHEYAHGGLSLQESLIPDMRVVAGVGPALATLRVAGVSWVGLRCRIRVDGSRPGLSVDLRTRVGDAASSVSDPRPVDAGGAASLLVADDALEGTPAALVVLDAAGQVLARQSTIIGGED